MQDKTPRKRSKFQNFIRVFRKAFVPTIPVVFGYLFMGMAFGALLASKGYGLPWAILMSVLIFAGSMQFVAIELLTTPISLFAVALMTLMVNARHIFYGLSLLKRFGKRGKLKPYLIFSLTDETYSLYCSPTVPDNAWTDLMMAGLNHLYWIIGGALGSLIFSILPINTKGIDFAMTALFVVIFVDQWRAQKNHFPALIGLVSATLMLILFGAEKFLLPAMVLILLLQLVFKKQCVAESSEKNSKTQNEQEDRK